MGDAKQQDMAAVELIDLESMRRFIVVAEELNFTRAAARLGLSQPPLSAAIGKLERRLGVRLLERTSRRVTLTPAGAELLEQGRIAARGPHSELVESSPLYREIVEKGLPDQVFLNRKPVEREVAGL